LPFCSQPFHPAAVIQPDADDVHVSCAQLAAALLRNFFRQTVLSKAAAALYPITSMPSRFLLVLAFAVFTSALGAQTPGTTPPALAATPPATLTLDQAVALALARNFDLKIQRITTDNAKESVVIAEAAFDPNFSLTGRRSYVREDDAGFVDSDGNFVPASVGSRQTTSANVSLSQRIATGAQVSVTSALARSKNRPSSAIFNPRYDSDIALSVTQPLLRDFGITINRASIQRARIGADRANFDLKGAVIDVVRDVEIAYFNVYFTRAQVEVRRFSLRLAETLLEENRTRRDTGVLTNLDVLQAEVGVANARRNLILAEQTVRDREDALLALIRPFEFTVAIGHLVIPELGTLLTSFDHSYKLARDNFPDLASSQLSIEQFKLDALVAKRDQLPILDVGGTIGYSGSGGTIDRATRRTREGDNYDWQLNATVSLPFGLRAEKARYRQARANLTREETRLQQIDQNLLVQVRAVVRDVQTSDESVRISELATRLSTGQFEAEKARYDAGQSTFRRVQEAQEDLDAARVAELQARINLRTALADLARLETTSLQRYNIQLQL
jgi:outer membrane protein